MSDEYVAKIISHTEMHSVDIEWSDPPPRPKVGAGRAVKHKWFFDALEANPGKWAKYPEERPYNVSAAMRKRGFQCVQRVLPTQPEDPSRKRTQAWVRFNPPKVD
jgi:hypothetical protein